MKKAICAFFSIALLLTSDMAHADAFSDYVQAIRTDTKLGPLIVCYNDGIWRVANQVARASNDEIEYKIRLIVMGGIAGIGWDVKLECDKWYDAQGIKGVDQEVREMKILFQEYVRQEHRKFIETCKDLASQSAHSPAKVEKLTLLCDKVRHIDDKQNRERN